MGILKDWKKEILPLKKEAILALIFFAVALFINYLSSNYINKRAILKEVPDLILDNTPAINLSFLYVWLYILILAIIIFYPLIFKPKKFHYSIFMLSLFIIIRSLFIIMTHLKTPVDAIPVIFPWIFNGLNFNNDMFFSGHTGLPFLGFLIFRNQNKKLGWFMLICSIVLGLTVLLMHQHYSIDVFSAFFITYGIYKFGNLFFKSIV